MDRRDFCAGVVATALTLISPRLLAAYKASNDGWSWPSPSTGDEPYWTAEPIHDAEHDWEVQFVRNEGRRQERCKRCGLTVCSLRWFHRGVMQKEWTRSLEAHGTPCVEATK